MKNLFYRYEKIIILVVFAVLVFGILLGTGTITSGLHMVDDHEYLEYELIRKDGGTLWDCLKFALSEDVGLRFRPMYFVVRILLYGIFGTNLTAWSVEKAFEIIGVLFLLYLSARRLKCSPFFALAFSLFVMTGPQSAVWWKLGPQESTGMLLFSAAFYFLLRWMDEGEKSSAFISCMAVTAMAMYKESFLLLIPFLILFCVYYPCIRESFGWKNVWMFVKKNIYIIAVYAAIFMIVLLVIVFSIGIMSPGYVGVDTSMSPNEYKHVWINSLRNCVNYFVWFSLGAGVILLTYAKQWKILVSSIIMGCAVVIPQMLIYLKTGLEERYILPWSFGVAFLFVLAVNLMDGFKRGRRLLYMLLIVIYFIPNFRLLVQEASYFTYRGHSVTSVLNAALENSTGDTFILSAYSPYEESDLTVTCWMQLHGRDNVYVWNQTEKTCLDRSGEGSGRIADVSEMEIILFYNPEDRHYCYDPDIDLSNYERIDYGTMTMCIRK